MYFIDVQGTLIDDKDKRPIKGAIAFIKKLNCEKIPYMIVTNNTKKNSKEFYNYLQGIGFDFSYKHYIDPLMLLKDRIPKEGVAAYGSEEFLTTLQKMGYMLEYINPKSVLLAIKEDFTSDEYAQMIDFLLSGATLVGMHETSIYAKNAKRYPGVGALLRMLEFATSSSYEVIGKPSTLFYAEALKLLKKQEPKASYEQITMISDDVKGDLGGAKELGMETIFVTSGKYKTAQEIVPLLEKDLRPDFVYADIQKILESI